MSLAWSTLFPATMQPNIKTRMSNTNIQRIQSILIALLLSLLSGCTTFYAGSNLEHKPNGTAQFNRAIKFKVNAQTSNGVDLDTILVLRRSYPDNFIDTDDAIPLNIEVISAFPEPDATGWGHYVKLIRVRVWVNDPEYAFTLDKTIEYERIVTPDSKKFSEFRAKDQLYGDFTFSDIDKFASDQCAYAIIKAIESADQEILMKLYKNWPKIQRDRRSKLL